MKKLMFLLPLLALVGCEGEKLKAKFNLSGVEGELFQHNQSATFPVEHNGEGVVIFNEGRVVSNSNQLNFNQFDFGVHKIRMAVYRGTDTADAEFRITVIPDDAPTSVRYEIVHTYPHPAELFTQGLVLDGDLVLESSGQYGESALSVYKLGSDEIIQQHKVPGSWFAEGLALIGDTLFQVTWKRGEGQTYYWDGSKFEITRAFRYQNREGWGLTSLDGKLLWTDGSERLRFVNPKDMSIEKTVKVLSNLGWFANLNELEMFRGRVAANLWQTSRIAFINPENGLVDHVLDLNELADRHSNAGVLNGMMVKGENLIVTGKNWPVMYELKLTW
ncbi:MAG: glutaminyl-peptide cyclotransferase [Flavobacteriia bacterium]|nr:glutaminyl-peptide cyclotransferase [Flavobacteriia bacterium]